MHENHDAYIDTCEACTGTWCNYCHEHVTEGDPK